MDYDFTPALAAAKTAGFDLHVKAPNTWTAVGVKTYVVGLFTMPVADVPWDKWADSVARRVGV